MRCVNENGQIINVDDFFFLTFISSFLTYEFLIIEERPKLETLRELRKSRRQKSSTPCSVGCIIEDLKLREKHSLSLH